LFNRPVGVASPVNTDRAFTCPDAATVDNGPMTFPGPLGHRAVRAAAKVVWLAIACYAVVRTTPALGASFYFEPTSDAVAAERHGHQVVALMCLVFVVLAAVAWYVFDAPAWSPLLLVGLALVLLVARATEWAYLAIPVPYVVVFAAAAGVILGRPAARSSSPG
jgi:hypothetical protein